MKIDLEELERKAMAGYSMPEGLPQPEQLLYLSLRILYREYRAGVISRAEAKKEKSMLLSEYNLSMFRYALFISEAQRRNRISAHLTELNTQGCEKCRLAARIFDGRES